MTFFSASKSAQSGKENRQKEAENKGLLGGLFKTRQSFANGLLNLFGGGGSIDEHLFEAIEDQLILADIGAVTSQKVLENLRKAVKENRYTESSQLLDCLRQTMVGLLGAPGNEKETGPPEIPHVVLMVGVNGVGKTTTLAKIANRYRGQGKKVMLAACDTFRAAAIEQLQTWGKRLDIPVIAQAHGADAAAVAFDAYGAAQAQKIDVLLIDTAGRQHTHGDLMEQLKKVKRVLARVNENIPHEILLAVDAGNGQNIHSQVESFHRAVEVSGLCVTKLDGTAKGGVVISVVAKYGLPVKYIGVGEGVDDLRPFVAAEFVAAMLPDLSSQSGNHRETI